MKSHSMILIGWVIVLVSIASARQSQFFDITKVADDVYAAIGKPGILSNAAVIVTDDGVIHCG